MKVVADTNVLVSALIFPGGSPEAVYRLALEGRLELASSRPLLAELARVLAEKFGWDVARAEQAVGQVIRISALVEPSERVFDIEEDPPDNRVLEAALAAGADVIVSGDRHLLGLGTWRGIRIRSPAELIAELTASEA